MTFVYILKNLKTGRFHIRSTNNLAKRLEEYNLGKNKATRYTRPFQLIYSEPHPTRTEAVKRERFLKTGQGRNWLRSEFS